MESKVNMKKNSLYSKHLAAQWVLAKLFIHYIALTKAYDEK